MTDCSCVRQIFERILRQAGRNSKDVEGGDKARGLGATKEYRLCGFSATQKDLICSGWQVGICLVELLPAAFNSCFKFLG